MSYNLSSIRVKKVDVTVPLSAFMNYEKLMNDRREISFASKSGKLIVGVGYDDEFIGELSEGLDYKIEHVRHGDYTSDYPISEYLFDLCKKYKGSVDMLEVWEGGDAIHHYVVENGVVITDEGIV